MEAIALPVAEAVFGSGLSAELAFGADELIGAFGLGGATEGAGALTAAAIDTLSTGGGVVGPLSELDTFVSDLGGVGANAVQMGPEGALQFSPVGTYGATSSAGIGASSDAGAGAPSETQFPAPVSNAVPQLTPRGQLEALAKGIFRPIGGGVNIGGQAVGISPFDVGKGIYGLYNSERLKQLAGKYASAADPYGPYRPGAAATYNQILSDPSAIYKLPGWGAGQEAVQRSMAAQGYQGSGNMAVAMQKYGQDFYNQALNQYGQAAGVGFNPANAAQIGMSGSTDAVNLAGQSLNSLGYGMAGGPGRRSFTNDEIARLLLTRQ